MLLTQPVKVVYVNQPIPVRKKSNRSPFYLKSRNNQVAPRPVFTCIDEIYSSGPLYYPTLTQTSLPSHVSSQETKDYKITKNQNYRKWLLAIIIIVIIICIIVIIVLLAVFLTR